MSDLEPITRREVFLNAIAEGGGEVPEPVTREEVYLKAILDNGGGGGGGDVTGVKGSAESSYRKGNVNIAPENLGLGTASVKDVPTSGDAGSQEVVLGNDSRLTDARNAADVQDWAKAETKPTYTASEIGAIPVTEKGVSNGVATLTEAGKVPEAQLPSYVDDAIEGYLYEGHFYADSAHTEEITGERGKIYVDLDTNRAYRWTGSTFVEIGDNNTFTANRALVSDANGKVSASSATSEEVGYLSGVTGAIQTQINGKQNSLTFDSTPTAQSTNPVTSGGIKSYIDEQGAKTVSGNPITITDAEAMNADHVVATITPTQTGSGTPSPSNVRPFVGFSSVDINVGSANIWDEETKNGYYLINNGAYINQSGQLCTKNFIHVLPNTTYMFVGTYDSIVYYDVNSAFISGEFLNNPIFTTPNNCYNIKFNLGSAYGGTYNNDVSVVCLSNTYTVQLGDTYYGGKLDVTSGKFVSEWRYVNLKDFSYSGLSGGGLGWIDFPNAQGETLSDKLVNNDNAWNSSVPCYKQGSGSLRVYGKTDLFTTGDYADSVICYKWATPIEIQLTPQQIALLENNNTITTNVSSLDITYQTNTAIGDTASALDKRVTSLESKVPQPPTTDGTYKLTVTVASGEPTYSWESAT